MRRRKWVEAVVSRQDTAEQLSTRVKYKPDREKKDSVVTALNDGGGTEATHDAGL